MGEQLSERCLSGVDRFFYNNPVFYTSQVCRLICRLWLCESGVLGAFFELFPAARPVDFVTGLI